MNPTDSPVEQHPVYGFRALRRSMANHPAKHQRKSVVEVHDVDLDWIDYKIETFSVPDEDDNTVFVCFIEYIDRSGQAHQISLPSPVVDRMKTHIETLSKGARSRRAQRGARTRKSRNARKKASEVKAQ